VDTPPRHHRLWVTRTQPQAEATAERLRALGWTPVVAPVLAVRPIPLELDPDILRTDALAFTSQTAVDLYAALDPRRDLPVFVVGHATAQAARRAGYRSVIAPPPGAAADVAALAARIAEAAPRPRRVLNPTAARPAADLVALLAERGVSGHAVPLYDTAPAPIDEPPPDLRGILIHSARAAEALAALIQPGAAARLTVWAISEAAAAPLRALPFQRILVAARPDEASMFARLGD